MQTFKTREFKIIEVEAIQGVRTVRVPMHITFTILPKLKQGIDLSLRQISRGTYNKYYKEPEPEAPVEEEPVADEITEETDGN